MATIRDSAGGRKSSRACAELEGLDTRVALIQALIPLGLAAVEEVLQQEVEQLAGPRYARRDGVDYRVRWGRQRGSVCLGDQKLPSGTGGRAGRFPCRPTPACSSPGRRMRECCGGCCTGSAAGITRRQRRRCPRRSG